jgi:Lar family restriction alleviation protein
MSVSLIDGHIDDDVLKEKPHLLPCPFCGGEAVIHSCSKFENESLNIIMTDKFGVHCKHCKIATLPLPDEEIAIEAWNRRVDNG